MDFLPIDLKEVEKDYVDFVLVTGDAYIDHPSFGAAIISRILVASGYSVGIIAQPNWKDLESFNTFKKPRLGFLVTAGNIDSMVNHYTVAKKRRNKDYYSPNGEMGLRPDRATIVYTNKIREKFGKIPIIIGGIEASLRRLSHYDYWDDNVRRSILLDSSADLLVYGMGEHQIVEIADSLQNNIPISELNYIKGTCYKTNSIENIESFVMLPSFGEILKSKEKYSESFLLQSQNTDAITAKILIESYKEGYIVQNTPSPPLTTEEFDQAYDLGYMRDYHPIYKSKGNIPAIEEIKFSIISNRGCFGSCNFCALTFHQGRTVQSRSHESILREAFLITNDKDFKGYIHDVGGPTANFRFPSCKKQLTKGVCKNKQCLAPTPCKELFVSHEDYLNLLRKLKNLPKIKKVFVRSGIRYDYLMLDKNKDVFIKELCENHVSGQLKVAPEHVSKLVLDKMGKPNIIIFNKFMKNFFDMNKKLGKEQYLVPYLMSSHPASDINSAIELAEYLRDSKLMPEQVQDFYPTPGTASTCMYYTEIDPYNKQKVFVEKNPHNKAIQRALMQYRLPQNYNLVLEGLKQANREDLIGFEQKSLIRGKSKINTKPYYKKHQTKSIKKKTIRNIHKAKK